jgi:hypothetical protein
MDFKWKLSRPGIELEFETGSVREAIGILEEEGTQITEIFGFTTGTHQEAKQTAPAAEPAKTRKPRTPKQEAVAPEPLPVPVSAEADPYSKGIRDGIFVGREVPVAPPLVPMPSAAALAMPSPVAAPDLALAPDGGIPPFLARTAPLPALPVSPPPVGLLGPKVVAKLDEQVKAHPDSAPGWADWLAASGLTIKGKSYDDACRAVLMISDEKLKDVADALSVR